MNAIDRPGLPAWAGRRCRHRCRRVSRFALTSPRTFSRSAKFRLPPPSL
jgi:hypothetical protein